MASTICLPYRTRRRRQTGAAVLETFIVVPVLFTLVLIILEVANILRVYETLSWAGEYAVRQATEGMDADDQRLSPSLWAIDISEKMEDLGLSQYMYLDGICLDYSDKGSAWPHSPSCGTDYASSSGVEPGYFVRISLSLQYQPIFSIPMLPEIAPSVTFQRVVSR